MLETDSPTRLKNSKLTPESASRNTDSALRRHLVRLWLRDPEYAWQTPAALSEQWAGVYDEVTPEDQVFPLEPSIRSSSDGLSRKADTPTQY